VIAPVLTLLHLDDVAVRQPPASIPFQLNFAGKTPGFVDLVLLQTGGVFVDIDLSTLASDSDKFGVARTLVVAAIFQNGAITPGPLYISVLGTRHLTILTPTINNTLTPGDHTFNLPTLSAAIPLVCTKGSIIRIAQGASSNNLCAMSASFSLLNYTLPAFVR
jgi:hypothetical protein